MQHAAHENFLVEQYSNAQQWNDLPTHDGIPNFAQGNQQSLHHIVKEIVENMQSLNTLLTFMGSLAHGGTPYEQVDQHSLCNIGANEIFDDGQSLDSQQCSSFGHDMLPGYEQVDQQSVHNIDNKSVHEGQLPKIVLSSGSSKHAETPDWQVDQQNLPNINTNDIFDEDKISDYEAD